MAARARPRALFARAIGGQRPKVSKGVQCGTVLKCSDNTGGRVLRLIQVIGYKGRLRRVPLAGVGDLIMASVRKGTPDMRRKLFRAVVIRQKMPFRRPEGVWVRFEDNAAVIITAEGEMKGSEIRGPVAREAAERWPRIASASSTIV